MITLKFPKSPRTDPRRKIQEIGKKYDYSEDSYLSIIKIPEVNDDLYDIMDIMGYWKNSYCYIDDEEIVLFHLKRILECIENKIPFTNTKWFDIHRFSWNKEDMIDIKEGIDDLNNPKIDSRLGDYSLDSLKEMNLISVVTYKKEYIVEKERFKQEIIDKTKIIKKVYPKFDESKSLEIIDSFADKIIIKEEPEEDVPIPTPEPEGEEWVDWYNPTKLAFEVRNSLIEISKTLNKIEENTRR